MKMNFVNLSATIAFAICIGSLSAQAGSIENMERERSILLQTFLNPELSAEERQKKVSISKQRLVDLERIVLRDKTLAGRSTPAVKLAFSNYDLTFLIHSSIEKNTMVINQWLNQLGLSPQNIMSAAQRRR